MTDIMDRIKDGLDEVLAPDAPDAPDALGVGAAAIEDESIYRLRRHLEGYDKIPWSAYFYYVGKPGAGGKRPVTFYQYASHHGPIPYDELKGLITQLGTNARAPLATQNPQPLTAAFKWTRKSYIIMLVDDPVYEFEVGNAVTIVAEYNGQNHTFFDGKDFPRIKLPNGSGFDIVTAVCFIDHMKRDSTTIDDLGEEEVQRFKATYSPAMEFVAALVGGEAGAVADGLLGDDDNGTNMGPPIGPP